MLFVFITKSFAYFDIDKKKGAIISGKLTLDPKASVDLGEGEWTVFETDGWFVNAIQSKYIALFQIDENTNEVMRWIEVIELSGLRKWTGYLMPWLEASFWKPDANKFKSDGCVKRSHYFLFEYIKRGMFYNCLVVTILDIDRRLYGEDKNPYASRIRAAIRDGGIKLPKIMLKSEHLYLSFVDKDKLVQVYELINPKHFNYDIQGLTRDTSEFHPKNIAKHPKAQSVITKWSEIQKTRHNYLERALGAKDKRFLFEEFKKRKPKNITTSANKTLIKKNDDLVDQLKNLNKLYKSGALSKDEFEKAKKKILN